MNATFTKAERAQLAIIMGAITHEHGFAAKGGYVDLMHLATAASALVALCSTARARTDLEIRENSLKGRIARMNELQQRQIERD